MEDRKVLESKKCILMMTSGAIAIFFTGFPHVWSVYQPYMMEKAGWSQGQTSMCFYLALAVFVIGNIIGGRMQDGGNPRKVLAIGGGIFSAGIIFSAFLIQSLPIPFYLTYGVMQGFGQGMIYATILPTAQKWFPDRKGFASGLIVAANGLCGLIMAPLSRYFLKSVGPQSTLLIIGIVIAIACAFCTLFFSLPQKVKKNQNQKINMSRQLCASEMMRTKKFWFLLGAMFFGLIPYLLISPVSQNYQISKGIRETIAVSTVMIGSIMNASTRLFLPMAADKIGRVNCIKVVFIVAVVSMGILSGVSGYGITIAVILMYACYGGVMGSFPSLTSTLFGILHAGENYGCVMIGIILATIVAPCITSLMEKLGYGMNQVFLVGMGSAVVALILIWLLGREKKEVTVLLVK